MYRKTILLCLVLLLAAYALQKDQLSNDYRFHIEKSKNIENCPAPYLEPYCSDYPPLAHWFFSLFAFSEKGFILAHLLLLFLLIPFLIWKLTENTHSVIFYFASAAWTHSIDGTVAQTAMLIIFLLFVWRKNNLDRIVLLFVALLTHSLGVFLLGLYWILESFEKKNLHLLAIPSIPVLQNFNFGNFVDFLIKTNPFNLVYGLYEGYKTNKIGLIGIILLSFLLSFWLPRILWVAQLGLVILMGRRKLTTFGIMFYFAWIADLFSVIYFPYKTPVSETYHFFLIFSLLAIIVKKVRIFEKLEK